MSVSQTGRLIVVGGGPAGMSAAAAARRRQPDRDITVFEQGRFVSSILCVLPYYISDVISDLSKLAVYTPDYFRRERRIDVLTNHRVESIDVLERSVRVVEKGTGRPSEWSFGSLVLATGARPRLPAVPGTNLKQVYTLRSIEEAVEIKEWLNRNRPRRAVVVGAGYVGLEMVEALRSLGLEVHLLEASDGILQGLDPELAAVVERELEGNGVTLHKAEGVSGLLGDYRGNVRRVVTSRGEYEAEVVVLATGVAPAAELAQQSGVALGTAGAIRVDDRMSTSAPSVLAAGDVAEAWHRITRCPAYVPLGTTANRQGRVAGSNVSGGDERFGGILGTSTVKVFGLEIARTGLSEAEAEAAGYWAMSEFQMVSTITTNPSRAGVYPGASPIIVKLIAEGHSRRLLGAQMVGREAVAKRLDSLAVAVHAGLTLDDLAELDLAYTPPLAPSVEAAVRAARQLLRQV